MTKGRILHTRWVRLIDPVFKATHYLFLGPAAELKKAVVSTLTPAERRCIGMADDPYAGVELNHGRVFGGGFGDDGPMVVVTWVNTSTTHDRLSTFVHEIGHAVDAVMEGRGVNHDAMFAEPWRYYTEFLFGARKGLGLCP